MNNKKNYLRKTLNNFIISLAIITILIPSLFVLLLTIISRLSFTSFYRTFPKIYNFFKNVYFALISDGTLIVLISFILWVVAFIIITIIFAKKINKYNDLIDQSYTFLLEDNKDFLNMPTEMADIENKVNEIKRNLEKKKKEAQESEQRKDDLVVYLAHDIKTPLTSMIGYLSLLDEEDISPKQRDKFIKIALEKSYKIEDLINELFDITRFNAEKIILEKEDVDLKLMLEQIIDDFYPILMSLNKKINLDMDKKIIIDADSEKLARVFNNVIKNAVNYSKEGTDIDIKVRKKEDIKIEISNIGKEIPKEKLDRIFEKFYRVDNSRNTKTGGSGLGLAIAKEIVLLHGGKIYATCENKKVIFHISLPI